MECVAQARLTLAQSYGCEVMNRMKSRRSGYLMPSAR